MNEKEIKCILIDYLMKKYPNGIIAVEVPFLAGQRRVDVMLITENELVAFEIKSELDSLRRLEGQLIDYQETFTQVYVILSEKFKQQHSIISLLPQNVGYGFLKTKSREICIKRNAKKRTRLSKENLSFFLWRKDLQALGRSNDSANSLRKKFIKNNSVIMILAMAIEAIRARYEIRFNDFKKSKSKYTHLEDLEDLTTTYGEIF